MIFAFKSVKCCKLQGTFLTQRDNDQLQSITFRSADLYDTPAENGNKAGNGNNRCMYRHFSSRNNYWILRCFSPCTEDWDEHSHNAYFRTGFNVFGLGDS